MKIIKFWYPPAYEIIITDDPMAQDKKNIFVDSVRNILSELAAKTAMIINLGYVETPAGKQEITKEILSKIKLKHRDINEISPFHTFQLRQVKVGPYIHFALHHMYAIDAIVRQTQNDSSSSISFEEFVQNIILEYLMKLTGEVEARTRPKDDEEEEEEKEPLKSK